MALDILNILKEILQAIKNRGIKDKYLLSVPEVRSTLNAGTQLTKELVDLGFLDSLQFKNEKSVIADSIPVFIDKYRNQDIRSLIKEERKKRENEKSTQVF